MAKCFAGHNECVDVLEFQRADKGASPERARFNASMIDVSSLKPGQDFTELPEVYVIFITEHDVLGYGLPMYEIDRVISENSQPFNDRSHIIYVNGEYRDESTPLGRLVHDLFCRNAGEMYYEALAQRVSYLKEETKGVKEVSGVMEELFEEQKKTFAERMIADGKLALKEIAEYTGLSLSAVKQLAKKLEEARA